MLNRSNIEEANKHLQALYGRVSELEGIAQEQHDTLLAKDSFIQTKIKELSKQDIIIQDLRNMLKEKDEMLASKDKLIEELNSSLDVKNKELSCLKQQSKSLNDFMKLATALKSVMSEMDTVVENVNEIEDFGDLNEIESPIDGGYIDNDNVLTSGIDSDRGMANLTNDKNIWKTSIRDDGISRNSGNNPDYVEMVAKTNDLKASLHSPTQGESEHYFSCGYIQQKARMSKFSVSEDSDQEADKVELNDTSQASSGQREVYF